MDRQIDKQTDRQTEQNTTDRYDRQIQRVRKYQKFYEVTSKESAQQCLKNSGQEALTNLMSEERKREKKNIIKIIPRYTTVYCIPEA